MLIIGIDVGKKGGICLIEINKEREIKIVDYKEMGDNQWEIKRIIEIWREKYGKIGKIIIEKQKAIRNQNVMATFSIARQQGFLEGIAIGLNIEYELIEVRDWQKVIKEEEIKEEEEFSKLKTTKAKSLSMIKRLHPEIYLYTKRGRLLDGISDAICIVYGYINMKYKSIKID